MVRDNRPTALADDGRVRHALRVADLHDAVDDVARILVERVVRGTVEGRARAVVVHPKPAADIQVAELMAHLLKLGIEARGLLYCALDRADVRHLRADVKMYELEGVRETRPRQKIAGRHELGRAQTEFRVFSAAGRPFARRPWQRGAREGRCTARPASGRRPRRIWSSSSSFSTTMITVLPSLRPSSAFRMKAVSL